MKSTKIDRILEKRCVNELLYWWRLLRICIKVKSNYL